jgi:hypothetical protein
MNRVLRRGGRLAVAVWDSLEHFEGYKELTALVARLHGEQAAEALLALLISARRVPDEYQRAKPYRVEKSA